MSTPNGVFYIITSGVRNMLRLKDLREDHELTQEQCAKIGYIAKNSYIRYEKEERVIPLDTLIYYAKYYNTSLDYIAGLTNISKPYPKEK